GPTGNSFGGKSGNQHASTASIIVGLALAVVVLAGILSRSRGGMVLTMLGGTLTTLLMIRMKALGKKSIAVLAGIGVVVLMGLWLHGTDAITEELETLTAGSLDQLDHTEGRRIIWSTNVRAAKAFPWLGTGIGSHRDMHHAFLDRAVPVEYSHAESVYLQVLSEAGIVGLVLFSLAIICVGWHLLRALRSQSHSQQLCAMALLSGLTVSLVSCIFDFAWYLPGCMTITIFLTGCAVQLGRLTTSEKMSRSARPLSRWAWGGAALFVGLVFVSIERHQLPYVRAASAWNRYLTLSLNASNEVDNRITNRDNLVSMAIQSESRDDKLLEELEEVVRVCPQHSRAHLRMASILLRNFARAQQLAPNPMDLSQIRDAAIASKFPSRPAQDAWLNAALGGNRQLIDEAYVHTTRSIATSPLQGRAYLYLADLVFLQGVGKEGTSQLLAQAHQLRPHDAAVLFILGREAALRGDTASALQYWKDSYHSSPEFRRGIVQTLAPQMPPQVFLEQFQPDTNMVRELYAFYRAAGLDEHAKLVVPDYAETFKEEALHASGSTATRLWQRAVDAYRFAGDAERTLECCARAAQASPTNVEAREDLARQLLDMDRLDESLKQYQWCLNKKPLDDKLRRRVREITKQIDVRRMQAIYQVDQGSYNNPTAQYPSAVLQR
ncbi:MAG: O-antigen ligase family protein, partial [Planctomycetales bacterium]|nr:O-antigen ligase family protein [Planctomycetales bacterium]